MVFLKFPVVNLNFGLTHITELFNCIFIKVHSIITISLLDLFDLIKNGKGFIFHLPTSDHGSTEDLGKDFVLSP